MHKAAERTVCAWRSIVVRSMMGAADGHPPRCYSWLCPIAASSLCPLIRLGLLLSLLQGPCRSNTLISTD